MWLTVKSLQASARVGKEEFTPGRGTDANLLSWRIINSIWFQEGIEPVASGSNAYECASPKVRHSPPGRYSLTAILLDKNQYRSFACPTRNDVIPSHQCNIIKHGPYHPFERVLVAVS